jgi:hypothetical protein
MPTNKNREMKLLKCVTDVIQIIFKQTLRKFQYFYIVCEFIKRRKKNKVKKFFIFYYGTIYENRENIDILKGKKG